MTKKRISIITPVYNEEDNVQICYDTIRTIFETQLPDYEREHIFCDNASKDGTVDILRGLAEKDPCVKVILNARNFGPMRSNFNGVTSATGDAVLMFLAVDLQDPPELLPEFVKHWEDGNEIIFGIRANREEGFVMLNARKAYYRLMSSLSYVDIPPDVGEFQLIDRKVLDVIKTFDDAHPFARAMTFECGFKQIGVPYTCRERKRGVSKNRLMHLIDQGLNGLISFSTAPMRAALFTGVILATFAIVFAFINAFYFLFADQDAIPRGTTLLITALFFFSGVQLFFIGFLGEYVLAIFNQVRKRPLVVERERINF